MKKYALKVYDKAQTLITTVNPNILLSDISFSSQVNAGQGELNIALEMDWDAPEAWTDPFNFVRVYVYEAQNPLGRLIYTGAITQRVPYINGTTEGVSLVCLGLVSLLSQSIYKNGASFDVTHTAENPQAIIESIIDNHQTLYGTWVGYDAVAGIRAGGQIDTFTSSVTYEYKKTNWAQAITKTVDLTDSDWFWYIDQGGDVIFREQSTTADHVFTIGKDVQELQAPENTEEIINSVTLKYNGGTTAAQEDSASITKYFKRERYEEENDTTDSATAISKAQRILNENKEPKIQVKLVLNSNYDFESIKCGDTCKLRNYAKNSPVITDNMRIVAMTYSPEFCTLELGGKRFDLAQTIKNTI